MKHFYRVPTANYSIITISSSFFYRAATVHNNRATHTYKAFFFRTNFLSAITWDFLQSFNCGRGVCSTRRITSSEFPIWMDLFGNSFISESFDSLRLKWLFKLPCWENKTFRALKGKISFIRLSGIFLDDECVWKKNALSMPMRPNENVC